MITNERFETKLFRTNNCWLWTGALTSKDPFKGYGRFSYDRGVLAHRFSFEKAFHEIPDGLEIDHLCRVKCCVNPDHLEVVTKSVNALRGLTGHHKRPDICFHGHEYTAENTYRFPNDGRRACRICRREGTRMRRGKAADRKPRTYSKRHKTLLTKDHGNGKG